MTSRCPVCSTSLAGHDEASSAFHVNSCLDGIGASGATDHSEECPICQRQVPLVSLPVHVEECLFSKDSGANDLAIQHKASPTGEQGECPSCFQLWTAVDVPHSLRNEHVVACCAQREAMTTESSDDERSLHDTIDDQANSSSSGTWNRKRGFGLVSKSISSTGQSLRYTAGVIPKLSTVFERLANSGHSNTRSIYLCTPTVWHVKSQFGDFGWGCGYRNAQMILSAAARLPQYAEFFRPKPASGSSLPTVSNSQDVSLKERPGAHGEDIPILPSIAELQVLAEEAWAAGFDPEGRRHFKSKLKGSKRWIGTSEVYTMLTWLGIRATIFDFPKAADKPQSGTASAASETLLNWIIDYFKSKPDRPSSPSTSAYRAMMDSGGSAVSIRHDKMPLYLQHQGHSRTIVGVEATKAGDINLILFDPGKSIPKDLQLMDDSHPTDGKRRKVEANGREGSVVAAPGKLVAPFRVNLKSLSRKDEYQILRVETEGGPHNLEERRQRRIPSSLRVT